MFKKIINWWKYKKVLKEEYSKISFNCENCGEFYFDNSYCSLLNKHIKNPSCSICNRFLVSLYKINEAEKTALIKTSNFREVKK